MASFQGSARQQLIVGVDREGARRPVDAAFRAVRGHGRDDSAHILQTEPHGRELRRIDLDADCRLLLSADADLSDAGDLADVLDQNVFRIVVHRGDRQGVGMDVRMRIGGSAGLTFR